MLEASVYNNLIFKKSKEQILYIMQNCQACMEYNANSAECLV